VNRDDAAHSPRRAQFAQLRFADRLPRGWRMDIDRDFDREDVLLAADSFVAISKHGDRPHGQSTGRDEQFNLHR